MRRTGAGSIPQAVRENPRSGASSVALATQSTVFTPGVSDGTPCARWSGMATAPTVLCPIDFSDASRAALCYGVAIADHFGARLTALTVEDPLLAEVAATTGLGPRSAAKQIASCGS